MRKFLVPMLVAMWTVPAVAAGGTAPGVPLRIDPRGGVLVEVRVNDVGPFTFLVDTGASRSIVADDLARELQAPVVARSEVVTSVGSEMRLVVRLASVSIAPTRVSDVLAPVVHASQLSKLGPGVRGLLGQDFLSAFNYTLDYRRSRLTWDEPLACGVAGAVRMAETEGRFVMALADERGAPLRLVPDSGSEVLVLFRARRDPATAASATIAGLVSGERGATTRTLPPLRVGGVTLRHSTAYLTVRDDPHADGLLPLHGFSRVSFAAGGVCVVVTK